MILPAKNDDSTNDKNITWIVDQQSDIMYDLYIVYSGIDGCKRNYLICKHLGLDFLDLWFLFTG